MLYQNLWKLLPDHHGSLLFNNENETGFTFELKFPIESKVVSDYLIDISRSFFQLLPLDKKINDIRSTQ